ncbi:MAG: signal peptidase II [Syntrophobacteraceae bacterium]
MKKRRRILLVLFTILLCMASDQYTKVLARSHLPKNKAISFAKDTFRFDYLENKGGVLSFEHHLPDHWKGTTVTIAVSVFLALLIPYLMIGSALGTTTTFCLALFSGGALSNLLDRVALGGYVIDFLNLGWGTYRTCIFNVADAAIVSGGVLFLLSVSRHGAAIMGKGGRRPVAGHLTIED